MRKRPMDLAGRSVKTLALPSLAIERAFSYLDQIRLFGVMGPGGETIIFLPNEGGPIGWPFLIRSILWPMSLFRPTAMRNSPLLRHLYFISLCVGRSEILRFDGTRPTVGVMLSSRLQCQVNPPIACMEIGLVEFLRIARRALLSI